jgi:hypothetical protein
MATTHLLVELKLPQSKIQLYEDNQAYIKIALQDASLHKTKHIYSKVHYIRDLIRKR